MGIPVLILGESGSGKSCSLRNFDKEEVAKAIVKALGRKKGINTDEITGVDFQEFKETQYDKLADMVRQYMDMDAVYGMLREAKITQHIRGRIGYI